ncbi:choice-of-anchor M domain-containing protein [Streptomyces olivaceus]|uniref:choice-of-anchor M domain-containing protein n=1 Tax=Streptomyces olivaceus TaxID=47716 RepID=UPI0037A95F29
MGALALSMAGLVSAGAASGTDSVSTAVPAAHAAPLAADPAASDVVDERIVIDTGHVDAIAPRMVDGEFRTLFKDSRTTEVVWREPRSVIMHLTTAGELTIPEAGYDFLGAPGDVIYLIPQTQNPEVLWAGWSTEAFRDADIQGTFELSLSTLEGPGQLLMFDWDMFGQAVMKFDSTDGVGDTYPVAAQTHEHSNWAFTEPGVYRLGFNFSATLASGEVVSDSQIFTMAVGDVDTDSIALPGDDGDGGTDGGQTGGGTSDGGTTDGGQTGGTTNGGTTDGGQTGGTTDGGTTDGGQTSGTTNGGTTDGGTSNGGTAEGGTTDGGQTSGTTNGGTTDGGTSNGGTAEGGTTDGGQTGDNGTTGAVTGGATGGGSTSGGTSPSGGLAQTGAGLALPLGASGAALLVVGAGAAVYLHRRKQQSGAADGTDLPTASS